MSQENHNHGTSGGSRKLLGIFLVILSCVILAGSIGTFITLSNQGKQDQSVAKKQSPSSGNSATSTTVTSTNAPSPTLEPVTPVPMATLTTVATAQQNPYPPYAGTLALSAPLNDSTSPGRWQVSQTGSQGTSCAFSKDGYHLAISQPKATFVCPATATSYTNFVYQVEMTILKGEQGGIVFRANTTRIPSFNYYFHISRQGQYWLELQDREPAMLASGSSAAINTKEMQSNLLGVVARGANIDLYINMQHVASVRDASASKGQIGVVASAGTSPTEVVFRNARLWTL